MPKNVPKNTMIIGIDVFHRAKSNSFVAFVATLDPNFRHYFT